MGSHRPTEGTTHIVNSGSICTAVASVGPTHICIRITHLLGAGCCAVEPDCHVAGELIMMRVVATYCTSYHANLQLYVLNVFCTRFFVVHRFY